MKESRLGGNKRSEHATVRTENDEEQANNQIYLLLLFVSFLHCQGNTLTLSHGLNAGLSFCKDKSNICVKYIEES